MISKGVLYFPFLALYGNVQKMSMHNAEEWNRTSSRLFSFSTIRKRFSLDWRSSFNCSTFWFASSIGALYLDVPIISSRYSSRPSSCSEGALGFICAIDSTSPYQLRDEIDNTPAIAQSACLEDKESLMIKINPTIFQKSGDLGETRRSTVDGIVRFIASVCCACDNKFRSRYNSVSVWTGL